MIQFVKHMIVYWSYDFISNYVIYIAHYVFIMVIITGYIIYFRPSW
jgi:hypothetical protein